MTAPPLAAEHESLLLANGCEQATNIVGEDLVSPRIGDQV